MTFERLEPASGYHAFAGALSSWNKEKGVIDMHKQHLSQHCFRHALPYSKIPTLTLISILRPPGLSSNPRILLKFNRIKPIRRIIQPPVPVPTHPIRLLPPPWYLGLPNHVRLALQNLQREPPGSVPGNVAVQEPSARVIGLEGDGDVAL